MSKEGCGWILEVGRCSRLIVALYVAGLCAGCALVFPGHPASEYTRNERLELRVAPSESVGMKACVDAKGVAPLGIADLAPASVGFVIDQAARALEKEAGRFEAAYAITRSGEFYRAPPRYRDGRFEARLGLGRFALERSASRKASFLRALFSMPGARIAPEKTAAFDFEVIPSTCGDAFQIVLTGAYLRRSKAKVFHPQWDHYWWTRIPLVYGFLYDALNVVGVMDWGDGAIDLEIDVSIDAVWLDSKQQGRRATIGSFRTKLSDVKIGSGCEIPEFSKRGQSTAGRDCNVLGEGEVRSTGWLPAFPRSTYQKEAWGLGNYILSVRVSEFDEFGEAVAKAGEGVEQQRARIVERVVETVRGGSEER